jgi:propanol-preferring alcohol dehydrogenase
MRRMLLREAGPVEDGRLVEDDIPLPPPAPGQVALRVLACAVCRTDLHIVEGDLATSLPRVPGHQVVGQVEALGNGVDGIAVGDRVGVAWLASTCGACVSCGSGRENLCEAARFTGRDVDGGFAEAMLADARFVYSLPDTFSDIEAAPLLCAGIIGYRALKLSEVKREGRLGLFGFGASAHLAIQVANAWRCQTFVFTREASHRQHAFDLGAAWAGGLEDSPGVPLDAAVSFAPAGVVVPRALSRLARGGTLAVNAVHLSDIPSFTYDTLYWERTLRSVANYTRDDAREFLALAADIGVRAETETHPLRNANEALTRVKRGDVRGAAVLVPGTR